MIKPLAIKIFPQAERDLKESYLYIFHDNPVAADFFLTAIDDLFQMLSEFPRLGLLWPRIVGVPLLRTCPVPGFRRYLVFYTITRREIRIVAVMHVARDLDLELDSRFPWGA